MQLNNWMFGEYHYFVWLTTSSFSYRVDMRAMVDDNVPQGTAVCRASGIIHWVSIFNRSPAHNSRDV